MSSATKIFVLASFLCASMGWCNESSSAKSEKETAGKARQTPEVSVDPSTNVRREMPTGMQPGMMLGMHPGMIPPNPGMGAGSFVQSFHPPIPEWGAWNGLFAGGPPGLNMGHHRFQSPYGQFNSPPNSNVALSSQSVQKEEMTAPATGNAQLSSQGVQKEELEIKESQTGKKAEEEKEAKKPVRETAPQDASLSSQGQFPYYGSPYGYGYPYGGYGGYGYPYGYGYGYPYTGYGYPYTYGYGYPGAYMMANSMAVDPIYQIDQQAAATALSSSNVALAA